MSNQLVIQSHRGPYTVHFDKNAIAKLNKKVPDDSHFIIDERVAQLYAAKLPNVLMSPSLLRLPATEESKSLDRFPAYFEHLVEHGVRRDHTLIAIGGGIIQDINCFIAATLMRGVSWKLYPTTLLSQADSCIGSKSSINTAGAKNILGTFTPPDEVYISTQFLETLAEEDIRSGVGEILKVHAIAGPDHFDRLATDYSRLFNDPAIMGHYIRRALEIKQPFVEEDEFDRGPRNIFNYGHSFGHAIEAATNFTIPHGLAVTMGMDMANFLAYRVEYGSEETFARMHPTLRSNYRGYETLAVPVEPFLTALAKDKKNTGMGSVTVILPDRNARLHKVTQANDSQFVTACGEYFDNIRLS